MLSFKNYFIVLFLCGIIFEISSNNTLKSKVKNIQMYDIRKFIFLSVMKSKEG